MEIWKIINEYPDYKVSNMGNVKSIERKVKSKCGSMRTVCERILKPSKDGSGYLFVKFYKKGKIKNMKIHRLVADAFLQNPDNLPLVNHKDENKLNNNVENLEFCDAMYNVNYGTRNERISKKVKCIETDIIFSSVREIEKQLLFNHSNISKCCNGKRKSAYKYHWEWV